MAVGTIQGHSLNLSNLNLLSSFIIHVSVCRVVEKNKMQMMLINQVRLNFKITNSLKNDKNRLSQVLYSKV